jgi:hypothetical protein
MIWDFPDSARSARWKHVPLSFDLLFEVQNLLCLERMNLEEIPAANREEL